MNIYLVRHGETEDNFKKVYYGKKDSSLNSKGRKEAEKVGEILKEVSFNKIFVSSTKRAKETAEAIIGSKEYIEDEKLNEMDMGIFEGKDYKELKKIYTKEWEEWTADWVNYKIREGESFKEFYERVESFIKELKKGKEENILIVTHAGVIKCMLTYVLGGNFDCFWKFKIRNGDITLIKYEYGNIYIDYIMPMTVAEGGS